MTKRLMVPQPHVSIIIPCYNAEQYVGEAIQSALDQTYPHTEVIVIDDGSTDGSLDVIKSFGDAIRWETGPNRGGCAARNRGIELAEGELIQFLDADDILMPEKLERQVAIAVHHRPAIVYCDYDRIIMNGGQVCERHSRECENMDPLVFALKTVLLQTSAPLHWKTALDYIGGFRTDLKGSQEFDLHVRLAAKGAVFHHLRESLYIVRTRAGSVSSDFPRTIGEQLKCFPQLACELRTRGELSDDRARAFAERLAWNGRGCMKHGARDLAMRFFQEAYQVHPEGGINDVYAPATRLLLKVFGPQFTEAFVRLKRRFISFPIATSTPRSSDVTAR